MSESFLAEHSQEFSKKYPGKYIAIVNNKLVAVSESEVEAFRIAKQKHPGKLISLSYVPRKDELVTLL
ncbi:MAG: DUF5678 domain-containing protein [Candidatus Aenigmatarchaeota archaeon]